MRPRQNQKEATCRRPALSSFIEPYAPSSGRLAQRPVPLDQPFSILSLLIPRARFALVVGGQSVWCRRFSSISDLYPPDTSSSPHLWSCDNKNVSRLRQLPLGIKITQSRTTVLPSPGLSYCPYVNLWSQFMALSFSTPSILQLHFKRAHPVSFKTQCNKIVYQWDRTRRDR